jgi:HEAT repeat protein
MSFYPELDNLSLEELINYFHRSPIDGKKYATVYYQEVAQLIRTKGKKGIKFLKSQLKKATTERLRGIILALTSPPLGDSEVENLLLSYLHDRRATIIAQAIDGLTSENQRKAISQIMPLLQHTSPYVRGSALRFISKFSPPSQAFSLLIGALKDINFIVRENAADELGELGQVKAISYLKPLLTDRHPHVQQAAKTAIEMLETRALASLNRSNKE